MSGEVTSSMTSQRWKPYSTYKDSAVEWLGEIPAHWEVKALKRACLRSALYGANEPAGSYANDGIRFLRTTDIDDDGQLAQDRAVYLEEALVEEFLLAEGDLLLSRSGTIGRSFLYDSTIHGKCAYAGYLVRFTFSHENFPRFAFYFTKSRAFFDWLGVSVIQSTIGNVNGQKYANMPLPCPPLAEQRTVSLFLDREMAKIDVLVAKKERLIELLREKRTALISHAVTKGLDPSVPMRDSGIEWLGEVPAQWEILSVKRRAKRIQTGTTPPTAEMDYYEDGSIPWFGPGSFGDDLLLVEPVKLISETAVNAGVARMFGAGSTMVVTIGATIGKVGYIDKVSSSNQQVTAVTFDTKRMVPKYAAYQLKQLEPVLRAIAPSTTLPILDQDEVGRLPLAIPLLSEQRAIAAFLDRETAKIDALIAKIQEAIERLKEYRTALISAAVTGKIDVREEAA